MITGKAYYYIEDVEMVPKSEFDRLHAELAEVKAHSDELQTELEHLRTQRDALTAKCADLERIARNIHDFIDERIATLPCESRQRDLPEDDWSTLMTLRDILYIALAGANERGE